MQSQLRYLGVKIFLTFLTAVSLVSLPVPSYATGDVKQKPKHSTPELIEAGVKKGIIDSDTAYLYFAYALQDDKKLPVEYRGDVPYDGTPILIKLRTVVRKNEVKSSVKSKIAAIIDTICTTPYPASSDPLTQVTTDHFYIEYSSIEGGLTIDSYINSLEAVWNKEINAFGWAAPPALPQGSPPGGRYHVQIIDLPTNLYGIVSDEGTYAGMVGDNPNTVWEDGDAEASCMVLNNNMSELGASASPQLALDSTTSHELNHAIQWGYTALNPDKNTQGIVPNDNFIEGGATWIEDEVFDANNDNYRQLWPRFELSLGEDFGYPNTYANWIIFRGLTESHGAGIPDGAEQIMQRFWESISQGNGDSFTAMDTALAQKGTNLSDAYFAYAIAVKFNKACTGGYSYPYCFKEGPDYVAEAGNTVVHDTIVTPGQSHLGLLAGSYALNWIEMPIQNQYDVILKNTHTSGEFRVAVVCDTNAEFVIHEFPSFVRAGQSSTLHNIDTSDCSSIIAVIVNQDTSTSNNASYSLEVHSSSGGSGSRGFSPNGIHVKYYNDEPPIEPITLDGPINWNTLTTLAAEDDIQTINFDWGTTSPAPGVNGVFWSAKYEGTLLVPQDGTYTFYLDQLDDGGRLFIDYTSYINSWLVQGPHYYQENAYLTAGLHPITIEYAQGPGNQGSLSVLWELPGEFPKELIGPASAAASTPGPTSTPISGTPITPPPTAVSQTPIPPTAISTTPAPPPAAPPWWCFCSLLCPEEFRTMASLPENYSTPTPSAELTLRLAQAVDLAELLHRVQDEVMNQTPEGRRLIAQYTAYAPKIVARMAVDEVLSDQGLHAMNLFVPGLQVLVDGNGDTVTITAEQVQALQAFLEEVVLRGDTELQEVIEGERERHPLEAMIGMTMNEGWSYLSGYQIEWLPPISHANPYIGQQGLTIPVNFTLTDLDGNFVEDQFVTLLVLDANGNVVIGPIGVANNPAQGIKIQDKKYHYNLDTEILQAGTYTVQIFYNSAVPGEPAIWQIRLTEGKK